MGSSVSIKILSNMNKLRLLLLRYNTFFKKFTNPSRAKYKFYLLLYYLKFFFYRVQIAYNHQ